jgi:hypothetical protein
VLAHPALFGSLTVGKSLLERKELIFMIGNWYLSFENSNRGLSHSPLSELQTEGGKGFNGAEKRKRRR